MLKLALFLGAISAITVQRYDADGNYVYQEKSFEVDDEAQAARDEERARIRAEKDARLEA